ncbi:hypothetical protein RHGRI_026965 [Rhododendron griersonianum]|uniref:Protein kinase domain-containing protein n=1 Tax=Rhododendron griersonianum TaxID=479676 RepID=A0AAV6IW43_9ERIC|nr:hypothetical protein RHGRI_026965 [Rhododendron griersonianum]
MRRRWGHKEWLAEVQFLGIVDHPNLVKLLGFCSAEGEKGYNASWCLGHMDMLPQNMSTLAILLSRVTYSFGVVLYEILSGRWTLERNRPTAEQKLLKWVKQYPVDSNRFSMIIDPQLRNQYSISAARKIAKLADSCLIKSAKDQPTMGHVVEILKQALEESKEASSSENRSSESSASKHAAALNKPPRRAGITDNASRATQSPR